SQVCQMASTLLAADPHCTIQAHAGSGILLVRLSEFEPTNTARLLTNKLHAAAIAAGGHCLLWSCPQREAMTRQATWGPMRPEAELMRRLKTQFDPRHILNPGRFYFDV